MTDQDNKATPLPSQDRSGVIVESRGSMSNKVEPMTPLPPPPALPPPTPAKSKE